MTNFGLTATSLFKIWTPAWSSTSTCGFHRGVVSSLDRLVLCLSSLGQFFLLFPFFFFNQRRLSSSSLSKKEPHLNFVKCEILTIYTNNMKNNPQDERLLRKFLPGDSPRYEIWTPSWFITFYLKYVFLTNSEAKIWFFWEVLGTMS